MFKMHDKMTNKEVMKMEKTVDKDILSILCEIHNRLNDIAITQQVIGLMNTSLASREKCYEFLCDFVEAQKTKYLDSIMPCYPCNPFPLRYDS